MFFYQENHSRREQAVKVERRRKQQAEEESKRPKGENGKRCEWQTMTAVMVLIIMHYDVFVCMHPSVRSFIHSFIHPALIRTLSGMDVVACSSGLCSPTFCSEEDGGGAGGRLHHRQTAGGHQEGLLSQEDQIPRPRRRTTPRRRRTAPRRSRTAPRR